MSDGSIRISVEVDGKQIEMTSKELDNLDAAGHRAGDGARDAEGGVKGVGNESGKASANIKKIATALGLVAVGAAAFKILRASLDDAIARFDTLNQFPRVLQALGVSAEDSERSIANLSDGIDGLPTKLDDIASTAQRMYTSFGDMDVATDSAIALNNALLGSGSSADQAKRGTEMYLKALQMGKVDMNLWNTLSETMDVGLVKIAEGFGFAGKTAKDDLYTALQDGTITLDDFNDKLIEVGTGTGIMAQLAKENSTGLATSWQNIQTAVARGATRVIESLDKLSREVTGNSIAQNFDGLKDVISAAFAVIGNVIEGTIPIINGLITVLQGTLAVAQVLSPVLIGLATAFAFHVVLNKFVAGLKASNAILMAAVASTKALTVATKAKTTAEATSTLTTHGATVALAAKTGAVKLSTLAIGVMTGSISASTAVSAIATKATYALGVAWRFLTGPIGWVTVGIGALVAGVTALVKWLNNSSAESERLKAETEALGESTDELKDSLNETSSAYEDNLSDIETSARANQELADVVEDLANKENKSASEKAILASHIDQLNESVDGLNLAYNEEADALNMSSEEMRKRVDLMEEQTSFNAAIERQKEIMEEQIEVEKEREEVNKLMEEYNQALKDGEVSSGEYQKQVAELSDQEVELKEAKEDLNEQYKENDIQIRESAQAIEEANIRQMESYEDMSEAQQQTFDKMKEEYESLQETATNAFDQISTESEYSLNEMIENMEHNRKATQEWGENRADIMEWASEQGHIGFMKWVEQLGIDHAGELAEMAKNLDESSGDQNKKLEELAKLYDKNTEAATDAMKKGLGDGFDEAVDMVVDFVDDSSTTMSSEMKSAGFDDIGKTVPDEFAGGFDSNTDVVFSGLNSFAREILSPFDKTSDDFNGIGVNAMSGLNRGLDHNRDRVMNTARSIAGSVASTMKSALAIHSPSLVMKDIGEDTGEGYLIGLQSKVRGVIQAAEDMARMSMPDIPVLKTSTPEMALGANGLAYSGGVQTVNRQSTVNNSRSYAPQINNYFTREESTPSEVARKNKQQQQRLAMETGF